MEDLATAASTWMGQRLELESRLPGGGEAEVWSASSKTERFVIHVSGTWRKPAEVSWSHAVAIEAATLVPEAVAPTLMRGGPAVSREFGTAYVTATTTDGTCSSPTDG